MAGVFCRVPGIRGCGGQGCARLGGIDTVSPAPPTPTRRPRHPDRLWLLLAAPLVAASWLPWWGLVAFVLVLGLMQLDRAAEVVRVPLLLLAAGVTVLPLLGGVPTGGLEALLGYAALFLPVVGLAVLLHVALGLLEIGRSGGAAWLSLALLPGVLGLAPSPVFGLAAGLGVGLLALALTALGSTGPEERPARRLTGSGRAVWNAALIGGVLAGALALATLALPSGAPGVTGAEPDRTPVTRVQERGPANPPPGAAAEAPRGAGSRTVRGSPAGQGQLPGADLVLLGSLLLLMSIIFVLWKVGAPRFQARRFRFEWWEVAALVGMGLLGAMLLAYGLSAGDAGGLPGTQAPEQNGPAGLGQSTTVEEDSGLGLRLIGWFNAAAFASALLLAAAFFWLGLRLRRRTDGAASETESKADATPGAPPEALHRVRLAYRAAQASLAAAGLGRAAAETPAEHAARAALTLPGLSAPLGSLVAAYAPVRYGGRVTDEDAEQAEAAAREIGTLSAGYTPPPPSSESELP